MVHCKSDNSAGCSLFVEDTLAFHFCFSTRAAFLSVRRSDQVFAKIFHRLTAADKGKTFTLHQRLLPQDVLREIRDLFPFVYLFDRSSGELRPIRTEHDVYRFLWYNGVQGPVDNLLGSFRDVAPDAPGFDETWLKAEGQRWKDLADEQVAGPTSPLERRLRDAERELEAMRRTVSWRLTRPLRFVRSYITKLKPAATDG